MKNSDGGAGVGLNRRRQPSGSLRLARRACDWRDEVEMGADSFVVYYGLRYVVADEDIEAVERRTDHRVIAARRTKLQTYFGRLTDGEPHFLFVGTQLGVFGVENDSLQAYDAPALERIINDTRRKLAEAGLPGEPQLHLQLQAQY
jgi:hypothetical protein